jgi:hypothetical protein
MVIKALKTWPTGFKLFFHRCSVVPFEVALGVLAMWTGYTSFFEWTVAARAFGSSLPGYMTDGFNLVYLVSGAFILVGVGWGYRNVEASGVILLATVFLVRVMALLFSVGITPETTSALVQSLTFGFACMIRLRCILKNCVMVYAADIPEIIERQARGMGVKP